MVELIIITQLRVGKKVGRSRRGKMERSVVKKLPFSSPKRFAPNIGVEERVGSSVGAVLTKWRAIQGWVWCHKTKGQSDS